MTSIDMADIGNTEDRSLHQWGNINLPRWTDLQTVFGFIIGLLIALLGLEYLGSGTNPFETHPWTMLHFIWASFAYTIAVLADIMIGGADNSTSSYLFRYMYLISGSLACELLGFVLVGPFCLLLMNLSALLLVVLLRRFNLQIQTFNQPIATTAQQQITDTLQDVTATIEAPQVGEVQMTI